MAREFVTENRRVNEDNELVIDIAGGFGTYGEACKAARIAAIAAAQRGIETGFIAKPRRKNYNEEALHYVSKNTRNGMVVIVKSDMGSNLVKLDVIRVAKES